MNELHIPAHSTRMLIKASTIAIIVAMLLLITCILPAEYDIDPTGVGQALGLTSIAQASNTAEGIIIDRGDQMDLLREDQVDIVIPAGKGLEYKLLMNKHAHVEYQWSTDGAALYFDFHGEPAGDTTGYYESFSITTANDMKGSLTTPFKGLHGWYWQNKTQQPVTVSLSMKGYYTIKG